VDLEENFQEGHQGVLDLLLEGHHIMAGPNICFERLNLVPVVEFIEFNSMGLVGAS
jgi:hypothetical protein